MELLQLRYFCIVAKHENMTRAAEELYVAQSSLSKAVKKLETELGMPLFNRVGKRLSLNQWGINFYKNVSASLQQLDNAVEEIYHGREEISGTVTLWIMAAINMVSYLIKMFKHKYPAVNVRVLVPFNDLGFMESQDFDLCIYGTPDKWDGANKRQLLKSEELVLAVPKEHPLAGCGTIDFFEAAPYPFISTTEESSLRRLLMALCQEAGFAPNIVAECTHDTIYKELIRSELGISLIPLYTMNQIFSDKIDIVRINSSLNKRDIWLAWNSNRCMSKAAQALKEHTVEMFANYGSFL